jgi:hypothetical protein
MHSSRLSYLRVFPAIIGVFLVAGAARAQDVSLYEIRASDDVFQRTADETLKRAPIIERLPSLDCALEYLRRSQNGEIVYRRGPISLHLGDAEGSGAIDASRPAAPSNAVGFRGGLLVELARPGETAGTVPSDANGERYMLRTAIIPQRYVDSTLTAVIVLERAVVDVRDMVITIRESEVFSRPITIRGNDPLNFTMPSWEVASNQMTQSIPPALEEALLVTLETPRNFGFARNTPEPFSGATLVTYAVPEPCNISLRVRLRDGERVIDEGPREPGVYNVEWSAGGIPDGIYRATLRATDASGREIHSSDLMLTRSRTAESWEGGPVRTLGLEPFDRIAISAESGAAFQLPRDAAQSFRNMFTHIALRVGYRLTRELELGVVVGQDAFHERPGPEVDIDRINNFGGVVAYTYGYVGTYARYAPWHGALQPLVQVAAGLTDKGTLLEGGLGLRAQVVRQVEVFLLPTVAMHVRSLLSTKIGFSYGASLRF